ncbi:MAG: hypothetical protein L3K06_08675 [Thermoplasmata archaeon]|nr:hypothetical protein [Thermoplasmata archaeon]
MSSLWTPSGEHVPEPGTEPDAEPSPGPAPEPDHVADEGPGFTEAEAAEMRRIRDELARTPAADIIANHAVGLWQLAVLHLTPDDGPARLDQAALAIDALSGIVDGLGDRMGEHAEPLREALAQLRLAYVQVRDREAAPG